MQKKSNFDLLINQRATKCESRQEGVDMNQNSKIMLALTKVDFESFQNQIWGYLKHFEATIFLMKMSTISTLFCRDSDAQL